MDNLNFYRALEDRYRGNRELIKSRLEQYSPFLELLTSKYDKCTALDVGCGRGEWLELLAEKNFIPQGVDLDTGMLAACLERGFDVKEADGIEYLETFESNSLHLISAFHVVEHISFEQLQNLVRQSHRVLVPGGLLILETPNPENIAVASANFYLDPTHIKPIPPLLLSFVTEFAGFKHNKIVRLQESVELKEKKNISPSEVLFGVSPDYSVVAQKPIDNESEIGKTSIFQQDFGLSLSELSSRLDKRLVSIEAKASEAEVRASEAEASFINLKSQFEIFKKEAQSKNLFLKHKNYVKRNLFLKHKNYVKRNPRLKNFLLKIITYAPSLRGIVNQSYYDKGFRYDLFATSSKNKELLIDISHVYADDLKTGIQRVVRSIVGQLQSNVFSGVRETYDIKLVYLTDRNDFWSYRYVENNQVVVPKEGDLFLGLDFVSNIIEAEKFGLFDDWKRRGVGVHIIVYDILPISNPEWWCEGVSLHHELWLKTAFKISNSLICISNDVSRKVLEYGRKKKLLVDNLQVDYFHLGADISSSKPSFGIPEGSEDIINTIKAKLSFLMVSTIEPRKGHAQVLEAFEQLWEEGFNLNLVIVGKMGWLVEDFVAKLRAHPELNKRLFWLEGISDEFLEQVYNASTCLIAASYGEGFGLPLIEAAQKKKPIIARDIPVFREVAGEYAYYFNSKKPARLAASIKEWIGQFKQKKHPSSFGVSWLSWQDATKDLIKKMEL